MRPISKAELKLEKHISKLKGQLASAQYALDLLRSGNRQIIVRNSHRPAELSEDSFGYDREIPLFS
jgi:hypothetical protein